MRRLHRDPESLADVLPRHPVELSCQRHVFTRDPLDRLAQLDCKHRHIKVFRLRDRPLRLTTRRCGVARLRQSQLARNIQEGASCGRQRRLIEGRRPGRPTRTACHTASVLSLNLTTRRVRIVRGSRNVGDIQSRLDHDLARRARRPRVTGGSRCSRMVKESGPSWLHRHLPAGSWAARNRALARGHFMPPTVVGLAEIDLGAMQEPGKEPMSTNVWRGQRA